MDIDIGRLAEDAKNVLAAKYKIKKGSDIELGLSVAADCFAGKNSLFLLNYAKNGINTDPDIKDAVELVESSKDASYVRELFSELATTIFNYMGNNKYKIA